MRARLLLIVVLNIWTSLLLMPSNWKATPFDLAEIRDTPSPPTLPFPIQRMDRDDHDFSIRPRDKRKSSSSDHVAKLTDRFLKRGNRDLDSDGSAEVGHESGANETSDSDSDGSTDINDDNDANETGGSYGKSVREVTEEWPNFQKALEQRKKAIDKNLHGYWAPGEETNRLIDQMLGNPSTEAGEDLSRLILTKVPLSEVTNHVKDLHAILLGRLVCGWSKIKAISEEDCLGRIEILREANAVKYNWKRLDWPMKGVGILELQKKRQYIRNQWEVRPKGKTGLIFFNVPSGKVKRTTHFLDHSFGDGSEVEVKVLPHKDSDEKNTHRLWFYREIPDHRRG
ncbi:hypothetical protein FA10DRAFT_296961 [Acaromyces ingoldii]|uniref:SUN domain-containing protein n=1 Tax=Acaromyces ingoldii TaxID=215250 RepID=A0A316YGU8_9BASI|nr:hypothetical protein FA10DRAFT_296961 [Acaromyces ingoldii]PWN87333.1 hypothetical protein FA10DRAFT_296961 [Acaromyces ingoldii]